MGLARGVFEREFERGAHLGAAVCLELGNKTACFVEAIGRRRHAAPIQRSRKRVKFDDVKTIVRL